MIGFCVFNICQIFEKLFTKNLKGGSVKSENFVIIIIIITVIIIIIKLGGFTLVSWGRSM